MNIVSKVTGDSLTANEFNQIPDEMENLITSGGISPSDLDLQQITKAIAQYCADGNFYVASGTADAILLSTNGTRIPPVALTNGFKARFKAFADNTGNCTINVANLGAKSIYYDGSQLQAGEIKAGNFYEVEYDFTNDYFVIKKEVYPNIKYYDILSSLIADTTIKDGDMCITSGYNSANDGGAGLYTIREQTVSDVDDGGSIIFIANSLVAELVVNGVINVKQFGAKGDGTTDDTTKFNNCISFVETKNLHSIIIPEGTYKISLDFSGDTYNLEFYGNNSDFISANNEYIVKSDNSNYGYAGSGKTFYRCRFIGNQTTQYGVYIYATSGMNFEQCLFSGFTVAGAYLMFGQYCNFTLCGFSACTTTNAYGAYLDCIESPEGRTNEVAFTRCQFMSNYNGLGIFGCELTRVLNCTFQSNNNYGIYISGINDGGTLGYGTYIYGCWFEFNHNNYSIYDHQSYSTTIECCAFLTIGNQQIYMRDPRHNRIANNTSLSPSLNTIDLETTTSTGCSIYLINNVMSVTRNYVQVPQEFIIDSNSGGEGFQTKFLTANKITTANNTNLNLNTHLTAGARSCYLNFSQGDTVSSYIQQDFNSGKITHKTGFGTVGSIAFNMNGSDKYTFKHDRCLLPLPLRADNTAAQDLGTGALYRDNSGIVRVVY